MVYDGRRGQHRIWASTQSFWGTLLRSSGDFGKSWTNPQEASIRFPADTGVSLRNIWQISLGRARSARCSSRKHRCPQEIEYRSEEHTSELQSHNDLVCRLL